jgi:hypothetical protein
VVPELVKKPDASPRDFGIEKSRHLDDKSISKTPFTAQAQQEKRPPIDFAFLENSPSIHVFPRPNGLPQVDNLVALEIDAPVVDVTPKQSKKRRVMTSRGDCKHTTFMNDSIMEIDSFYGGGLKESVVGFLNEPLPDNIFNGDVLSEHPARINTPEPLPKFTSLELITEEVGPSP